MPGQRLQIQNPLYPLTDSSYSAYAIMLLALVVFAVGIVGNLSVMCIVWHSYYLKSAWNSILASLALWDFLILFFCLPVVIFNEITKQRLLGDISCRAVPFMEVSVCPSRAQPWGCSPGKGLKVVAGSWKANLCVCRILELWSLDSVCSFSPKLEKETNMHWFLAALRTRQPRGPGRCAGSLGSSLWPCRPHLLENRGDP
jgi:hypothetical protein